MQKLWIDFESYYDDVFSLRKMSPIEYINDPRFEALGCGFIDERGSKLWVDGPDLPMMFQKIDWPNTFAISHNALFDMVILSARYGIVPGMCGCTLSMARNWFGHQLSSVSLASVSRFLGLPDKMQTVVKTKGVNFLALTRDPALYAEVKEYAVDDAGKCKAIFEHIMATGFPEGELETVDMVIRMATQPKFELDQFVLSEHLAKVQADKQMLLDTALVDKADISSLMSDQQLAAKLLFLGVNPIPTKMSKTTGNPAYAFAKTDRQFTDLLEHEEPMVQALVAARLGVKSTLEETRTIRLINIGRVVEQMPVPLKYSAAHTHRLGGDWDINLQNLRRGGELRKAFKAPKGHAVVAIDASQIEARFNAEMSGQDDLVEQFRAGEDVYASFAELIYGYLVNKIEHPIERFVGKTGILSLGYGSSWPVFQAMCWAQGQVKLTDGDGARIVMTYRNRYARIVANWNHAQKVIIPMLMGVGHDDNMILAQLRNQPVEEFDPTMWGPVKILHEAIQLPNGNRLRYRDLKYVFEGKPSWTFMRGQRPHWIYGAKIVENVIQALAFIHIMEVALRVKKMTRGMLMPAHQVHDELIYIPPWHLAEQVREIVVREMSKPPVWMPNAPLAAEGHVGATYYDAK